MVRAKQNPQSKEAAMSLPSMTTAFCLSGIAGIALTSAAMPPIGDGLSHQPSGCELSMERMPCTEATYKAANPKYSIVLSRPDVLSGRCEKLAAADKKQIPVRLAVNCDHTDPTSATSRVD